MIKLADVHTHLEMPEFDADRDAVIKNAFEQAVDFICTVGTEPKYWNKVKELSEKYEKIYFSVGLHPHESHLINDNLLDKIKSLLNHKKCLSLGEIGLDFFKNYSPVDKQKVAFNLQLDIAEELNKPVMLHIRTAHKDAQEIIAKRKIKGIVHCFSGTVEDAKWYIKRGFFISIPGTVTFPKAIDVQEVVKAVPLDYILTETDAPFLAPAPNRGKRNEPAFVKYTLNKIAELKNLPLEDVARTININVKKAFQIDIEEKIKNVYQIRNSLYINLTNRCSNRCSFCGKNKDFFVKGHNLKLASEPTVEEIIRDIPEDLTKFDEIVFCGYGEPTIRLAELITIAKYLRNKNVKKIRLNTDGLANLRENKNIVPELSNVIDSISISLNASEKETYDKLCRPTIPDAFKALIDFIKECKAHIKEVVVSAVAVPNLDIEKIKNFAENELNVKFRKRDYDELG